MIKFWFYLFAVLFFCVIGLGLGSANDTQVTFDFLIVKYELPLAVVFIFGVLAGFIIALLIFAMVWLKMWFKVVKGRSDLKKALKEAAAAKAEALP